MVNESRCNSVALTSLLVNHHPEIADPIIEACRNKNIDVKIISGSNDYWSRDFMPLQVTEKKFVQFVYDPTYYRHPRYCHLKTNLNNLDFYPKGKIINSPVILDGGNVCYYNNKAIITDKVFRDNPGYKRNVLVEELSAILELDQIVFIPSLPYDITGHSDGMARFIDEDSLYINDFRLLSSKSFWNRLLKALKPFNLLLLPNDLHKNKIKDDATGDYINILTVKDQLFVAAYGNTTDELVYKLLERTNPGHTIIPIKANALSVKGGILHCATWNFLQ